MKYNFYTIAVKEGTLYDEFVVKIYRYDRLLCPSEFDVNTYIVNYVLLLLTRYCKLTVEQLFYKTDYNLREEK